MDVKVNLGEDYEQSLKKTMYEIATDAFKQVGQQASFPEWMNLTTAKDYIGVSNNTFTKYTKMGLPVTVIDGVTRVKKTEINKFMKQHSI